ncbi:MAG: glycosyltransferase family 39 protein [Candidatus Undinarchaeales archaeon]|jgi:hypothetical protein|nr:glycosyltransferase family 39 protein [Candidatus Undinarchaeales archaeon]MDP7492194.1 glycosyltransferase family 39 protein [Candidatus Undinarchaeales archaeon]
MIVSLAVSVFGPIIVAYLLLRHSCPEADDSPSLLVAMVCLAVGMGLGLASCVFFLHLLIPGLAGGPFVMMETAVLAGSAAVLWGALRERGKSIVPSRILEELLTSDVRALCLWSVLAIACLTFLLLSLAQPHGRWDAWAVWNLRARFLVKGGENWQDGFSPLLDVPHLDYPLLVPGLIARCWRYAGADVTVLPALISLLFTLATIGLTASALSLLRGRDQALVACLLLVGTPFYFLHGTTQYADVHLAFYILATLVLICLHDKGPGERRPLMILAGTMAGLAGWTKNEGLLFFVAIVAARLVIVAHSRGWQPSLRTMLPFTTGALVPLVMIVLFKGMLAPPNDLVAAQGADSTLDALLDPSRHARVWWALTTGILWFGNLAVPPTLVLALYLYLSGTERDLASGPTTALLALALMVVGYGLVYVTTPYPLHWHLQTSLDRLVLHLWPSLVVVLLLLTPPTEASALEGKSA